MRRDRQLSLPGTGGSPEAVVDACPRCRGKRLVPGKLGVVRCPECVTAEDLLPPPDTVAPEPGAVYRCVGRRDWYRGDQCRLTRRLSHYDLWYAEYLPGGAQLLLLGSQLARDWRRVPDDDL